MFALAGNISAQPRRNVTAAAVPTSCLRLDLTGNTWTMHEERSVETIPAIVPGVTYTDLMRAKKLPDPNYRENNGRDAKGVDLLWDLRYCQHFIREIDRQPIQWVADNNWIYERTFEVTSAMLTKRHVELRCHGLDTLATIWINDTQIGRTDNMFRTWSFDVKPHLRAGGNTIRIKFDTLMPYIEKNRAAYKKEHGIDINDPRSWVRKAAYMWGWDWCRPLLTQGIWKPIEILAYDARITDLGILQHHLKSGAVRLEIQTTALGSNANAHVDIRVMLGDNAVAEASAPVIDGTAISHVEISNPQLWWPNGMGEHPLYTVESQLHQSIGGIPASVTDTASRRIGLRKIQMLPPAGGWNSLRKEVHPYDLGNANSHKDGRPMHIEVNGLPVFLKGAAWCPADNIPSRVTPEVIREYMRIAIDCNFNFIRLWGGGYYEQSDFFDICDELGLMVQFEFVFTNDWGGTFPVRDKTWLDNVRVEVDQQVRRCRNHPSIVIWSGNNEIQIFTEGYDHLFRDVIGATVNRLVPGAFYEIGSGCAGSGDLHCWRVWGGVAPYSQYRTVGGLVTEFGMQSFPVPNTVDSYTNPSDRRSVYSPVMRYHEMDFSNHGIAEIMHYTNMYFGKSPESFDDILWLTQINQAYGVRYGVEHWRRDMPHSMAAIIWQFNDCWPGPTWSMTDYYRRFKAVQYQSKHFFAPILVSGIPDPKTGHVSLHITSDRQKDVSGVLRWWVTDLVGTVLKHGALAVEIPARISRLAHTLDLADIINSHGLANLLIWPEVRVGSVAVAENALFFGRPVELKLRNPQLAAHVAGSGRDYRLQITAGAPALWVWANVRHGAATYSNNFIAMRPGRTATIQIALEEPMAYGDFHRNLEVRSVYDIAPDMRG